MDMRVSGILMESFQEVWILNDQGTCIFSTHAQEDQAHLFGGFISTIAQLSKVLIQDSVDYFTIGKDNFFLSRDPETNLIFIVRTDQPQKKADKVQKKIVELKNQFKMKFPPAFSWNWEQNIEYIKSFQADVEKYLVKKP